MRVRMLKNFRGRAVGDEADVIDELAAIWIAHDIATEVQCMTVEPPRNAMAKRPRKRRKKAVPDAD